MKYDLAQQNQADAAFGHLQSLLEQEVTIEITTTDKEHPQRTNAQNRALHLMFQQLADELNNKGLYIQKVLKADAEVQWTQLGVKEYLWKPIQEAIIGAKSTTQLNTKDIDKVFETINKHVGEKFGIAIEFPSVESLINKERYGDK